MENKPTSEPVEIDPVKEVVEIKPKIEPKIEPVEFDHSLNYFDCLFADEFDLNGETDIFSVFDEELRNVEISEAAIEVDVEEEAQKKKRRVIVPSSPVCEAPLMEKEMAEGQKEGRRERNREHAKQSRIRKKVLLDTLQERLQGLLEENAQLRRTVKETLPAALSKEVLDQCTIEPSDLLRFRNSASDSEGSGPGGESSGGGGIVAKKKKKPIEKDIIGPDEKARMLMEGDYRLIQSLVQTQHNFVITDPKRPDNPIIFCSDGFCKLTGYKRSQIINQNCRFLQGPATDPAVVRKLKAAIVAGEDVAVCMLNYKQNKTPFWNNLFVAPLRDRGGQITHYVGVTEIKDRVKKLPVPDDM